MNSSERYPLTKFTEIVLNQTNDFFCCHCIINGKYKNSCISCKAHNKWDKYVYVNSSPASLLWDISYADMLEFGLEI